jgi:hypothetical protein
MGRDACLLRASSAAAGHAVDVLGSSPRHDPGVASRAHKFLRYQEGRGRNMSTTKKDPRATRARLEPVYRKGPPATPRLPPIWSDHSTGATSATRTPYTYTLPKDTSRDTNLPHPRNGALRATQRYGTHPNHPPYTIRRLQPYTAVPPTDLVTRTRTYLGQLKKEQETQQREQQDDINEWFQREKTRFDNAAKLRERMEYRQRILKRYAERETQ